MPLGKIPTAHIEGKSECQVVCLPETGRLALLAIFDRLTWRAAWDESADWDALQALIDETYRGLGNPMPCSDLLAAINAVETAVYATACCDPTGTTVGGGGGTVSLVGGSGTQPTSDTDAINGPFPVTTGTDPDNSGSVSASEFQDYLCNVGDLLVDAAQDVLQVLAAYLQGPNQLWVSWVNLSNQIVGAVASWLIPGFADDVSLYGFVDWANNVNQNILDTTVAEVQDAYDYLESIRQDLRCALQDVASASSAAAAFRALLDALPLAVSVASFLDNMPLLSILSLAWNGAFNVDWTADCSGCEAPPPDGFYWADGDSIPYTLGANTSFTVHDVNSATAVGTAINAGVYWSPSFTSWPAGSIWVAWVFEIVNDIWQGYGGTYNLVTIPDGKYYVYPTDLASEAYAQDIHDYMAALGYTEFVVRGDKDVNPDGQTTGYARFTQKTAGTATGLLTGIKVLRKES